ncbi:MAG: hypothetical protein SWH78_10115 [Thermodesulfobacteriota bacterium]|nr:hypothetical protein [Thermodesulfobacteriota bacterium]
MQILRIELVSIRNMTKFISDIYGCDFVPPEHLNAKVKYLFTVKPQAILVFVKNYNPQEMPVGRGAFRKLQCQYINQIKINIRNQYNPRHPDKSFRIHPLHRGVSHDHVIHSSDSEEQVDYFLKILGHKSGVRYLHGHTGNLPFEKPYYLHTPQTYIYRIIMIERLQALILNDSHGKAVTLTPTSICETPHYKALKYGTDDYTTYLAKFRYTLLTQDYSWKRLKKLNALNIDKIKAFERIIVTKEHDYYKILDGVHRAAVSLNHNLKHVRCVEFC